MKIFLDVGAHTGETLPAALDPRFAFDRVVCFEPASACWPHLRRVPDPRVRVEPIGLWSKTTSLEIHDPGEIGASILEKKYSSGKGTEEIAVVRASDWFAENLGSGGEIYAKLNVEGAEVEILEDLIATGEIKKLSALLVDLDIRKVPRNVRAPTKSSPTSTGPASDTRSEIRRAVPVARVQTWLERAGASSRPTTAGDRARSAGIRFRYVAIPSASRALRLGRLVQRIFGKRAHLLIRSRVLGYRYEDRKIRTKQNEASRSPARPTPGVRS